MTNPFTISGDILMNISTGQITRSLELVEAKEKGLNALERAEQSNVEKVAPVRLKTFVDKVTKKRAIDQIRDLFKEERSVARSMCFAGKLTEKEKIDQFYEWTRYPSSIFTSNALHPSGFLMRKGNRCDYIAMLRTVMALEWRQKEELPESDKKTLYFIDLMAFSQRY